MTNLEIIAKANEVVKGVTFTKLVKVTKGSGAVYLIVACGNGLGIYASYTSDAIYADWNNQIFRLA